MERISATALTVVGAIVALSILGAIGAVLLLNGGNAQGAAVVLGFLAPTITSLLVLLRAETTAKTALTMHTDNQAILAQLSGKVDGIGKIAEQAASAGASAAVAAQAAQSAASGQQQSEGST